MRGCSCARPKAIVGSTSVPGLAAKPVIDMIVLVEDLDAPIATLVQRGGYQYPPHQTPWQEIFRSLTDQLADGMVLKPAVKYQRVAQTNVPRDNH